MGLMRKVNSKKHHDVPIFFNFILAESFLSTEKMKSHFQQQRV